MTPRTLLRMAAAFALLLGAPACWSQAATQPQLNTASEGVKAADVEAAVGLICGARNVTRGKDGSVSGCRNCPKGTDFRGMPGNSWGLYAEIAGHFLSAHEDDLILSGSQCDSHAAHFGGSFVVRLKQGMPQLMKYDQGLITDLCHKFAFADGRNFLVCRGGWSGQGENDDSVFVSSFDAAGKDVPTNLMTTTDTTYTCGGDPTQVVQDSGVSDIQFATQESGGITGLTIVARLGNVKCSEVKGNNPATSVKTYEIRFVFDGERFKVAPDSRAALSRFENN